MIALLLLLATALAGWYGVQENSVCKYVSSKASSIDTGAGCSNKSDDTVECCGCVDNILGFIDLDGCAVMLIDWDNLNITFELTLNDTILFESTFGFNTAPALCTTLWGVDICVEFENIELQNWEFTGCLHLIIDNKTDINFGCWDIKRE